MNRITPLGSEFDPSTDALNQPKQEGSAQSSELLSVTGNSPKHIKDVKVTENASKHKRQHCFIDAIQDTMESAQKSTSAKIDAFDKFVNELDNSIHEHTRDFVNSIVQANTGRDIELIKRSITPPIEYSILHLKPKDYKSEGIEVPDTLVND